MPEIAVRSETHKRRTGEGIRRLSIVLGIVGLAIGCVYATPRFQALEHRRWSYACFDQQRKNHPKAKIDARVRELVLVELATPTPDSFVPDKAMDSTKMHGTASSDVIMDEIIAETPPLVIYQERFALGSDAPPRVLEYIALILPLAFGFLAPWGTTRAAAWVFDGFRADKTEG